LGGVGLGLSRWERGESGRGEGGMWGCRKERRYLNGEGGCGEEGGFRRGIGQEEMEGVSGGGRGKRRGTVRKGSIYFPTYQV